MGKSTETVVIKNLLDISKARHGKIMMSEIRSLEIEAEVDTRTPYLCLPPRIIEELGLTFDFYKHVSTGVGNLELRIFKGAEINIRDRSIEMQVMENKDESHTSSIGYLVLEEMGFEYDPKNEIISNIPV